MLNFAAYLFQNLSRHNFFSLFIARLCTEILNKETNGDLLQTLKLVQIKFLF